MTGSAEGDASDVRRGMPPSVNGPIPAARGPTYVADSIEAAHTMISTGSHNRTRRHTEAELPIAAVHPHVGRDQTSEVTSAVRFLDLEEGRLLQAESGGSARRPMDLSFLRNSLLDELSMGARVSVQFTGVSGWVPPTFQSPGLIQTLSRELSRQLSAVQNNEEGKPADKKQILCNVSGAAMPGEVLAVMGPSGSGKTSLISILGGRTPKVMETEGDILYNGKGLNKAIKRKIGFVLQDDLMFESLTVEETLYYAARLRLPKEMSRAEKRRRVDNVIAVLGLSKCRDTLIGGFTMPGVSGGERKRVSVGHELLINPAVIILDEPTSGLDATTAMHLLSTFRQLAEGGRSIVTTIHQPSSRLYQQLDNVMLLSEGRVMYYGAAHLALNWFEHLGHSCPAGMNIADFMLDLSNGKLDGEGRTNQKAVDGMIAGYSFFADHNRHGLRSKLQIEGASPPTDQEDQIWSGRSSSLRVKGSAALASEPSVKHADRWGAGFGEQCIILFERCLRTRRFDSLSVQRYLQILGISLVTGLLWWQRGGEDTLLSASDVAGLVFFEIIFVSFMTLFGALFTFPSDFKMMLKERASGMYRLSAYYIARSASELPMDCFIPTLYVIILYWFTGLRATAEAFIANWLTIVLVALVANSYGMLIGAAVMNFKSAQTIATLTMLTFMLSGGFYVRDVPVWISWLKYLSFPYWAFNIVLKVEFSSRVFEDCGGLTGESNTTECKQINDIADALSLPPEVNANVISEVSVLIGMLFVVRIVIYFVLRRKTRV